MGQWPHMASNKKMAIKGLKGMWPSMAKERMATNDKADNGHKWPKTFWPHMATKQWPQMAKQTMAINGQPEKMN